MEWIPMKEREPEKEGRYLITVFYQHLKGNPELEYRVTTDHWVAAKGRQISLVDGAYNGHFQIWPKADIMAWMPFPEPYKK